MADLLDDLLAASIDGLCVFDREHRCTHWSPALERLSGIAAADARGKLKNELFPEGERPFTLTFSPATDGGVIGVARKTEEGINEMLSVASHKLKTPLAAMQIHLGAQLRGIQRGKNVDKEWMEKCTASAIEQSMRMADTINMLVDVSRIDSGRWKLDWSQFELGSVAKHAVERLKHTAIENGCEVRFEAKGALDGMWDRVRLEEVLATLLANAFRHGGGKPVDFVVDGTGEQVKIVIADHGPGMDPEDFAQVFVRGPGTTLGLWIAKEIVLAHRGTIDLVTRQPDGSRFELLLPRTGP